MTGRTLSSAAVAWRLPPWAQIVPGTLLLLIIGLAGKVTEQSIAAYGRAHHLRLPNIEYVLWAIVFGLVVSNTVGVPRFPARRRHLRALAEDRHRAHRREVPARRFAKLGGVSLACVAWSSPPSIVFMTALGRAFRLPPKLVSLLFDRLLGLWGLGHHRGQGRDQADDEDASYAIAAILALGAVSLFVFPLIGQALAMSDHAYGLWVGLAVDNTAEAIAAGALYSDAAGQFAVLAKTARNATIGFVVLGYALYWLRRGGPRDRRQDDLSVAQVSEVRAGLPRRVGAGDRGHVRQRPGGQIWRIVALGVSPHVCRCWTTRPTSATS